MLKRTMSFLLAFIMVLGMFQFPVSAEETAADQAVTEPVVTEEPVVTAVEEVTEGGEVVVTDRYPDALLLSKGESKTYTFDTLTAKDGEMLLFAFDVRCETACAEISITLDFSGTDTTMKYYAPIQWSRIYMPVFCSGSFNKATVTVKTNSIYIGAATAENKGNTTIEAMNLQSGMWMLDDYEDVVLDGDVGVKNTNQDVYAQLGVTSSNCIDLVISSCGNYIYSIGGGYLTVTDVSDPANPRVRSIYNNPEYPTDYGDTRQIALIPGGGKTGDAVIFSSRISGAFIVDVSDPDNPVETAHYDALEMATGITTYEGYAFIANRQYGVEVVDLSDIYNPVHLGTVARGGEIQSCKVVDGILYAGAYDILKVEMYDVRDVLNPTYLGAASLNGRGDAMAVATVNGRTYLYAGTGHHSATSLTSGPLTNLNYGQGNGLEIFDVTDPTKPVLLSVSKTDGRFCHSKCDYWGAEVSIHNGRVYVYLLSTYNGVYVYDATDPTAPVRLAHVTARVDKDSPYYNTSNFSHTSSVYPPVFQYDPNEYKQAPMGSIAVHEGALYMAGVYTDLHIYEGSWAHTLYEDGDPVAVAPTTPYYDSSMVVTRPGSQTVAIANHGNYMYVAAGKQGILIYSKDLKTLHKTIPVEDLCYDLYIQDGKLYAAEGRNGAAVYTISADGLTLTEQKRYISSVDLVTTIRPSATGKFIALSVSSTRGEIVDISGTPKLVANCSTATQAYHHNVEVTENGRYVVFWGLSGNEQWYDFGANDGNSTPKRLSISPFKSRAAMQGGYTAYKGNTIIQTRSSGYIYYDPTTATAAQVEDMALNKLIRPVTGYGSTTKTSISGRGFVYENLLITCDRVYGKMYITDISDMDNPVLLKSWTGIKGNPDIATVVDKTLYVPMGYEGIMMLDLEQFEKPHLHCICGGVGTLGDHTTCTDVQWTPISQAFEAVGLTAQTADFGKLPAGNYYLDTDVVVTATSSIGTANGVKPTAAKDLKLCLNGHNITTQQTRVFGNVKAGSKLTISDCAEGGTVYGGTATYGQIAYTHAKATLNIYGGNFTSPNTATAAGLFAIACDSCGDLNGDGKEDDTDKTNSAAKSVFNLYGGKLYGGKAATGGNIALYHCAEMNMYGGTITGGEATTGNGGNIYSYSTGYINIHGGTVSGGTATKGYGGNIVNSKGTLQIYGGEILGGTAATYAGSIHNVKTFYLYGGTVSGGRSGNNAGGNIMVATGSTFNMYGGTVTGGTAPTSYGGNIQVLGTAYLCGGTIKNGTAKYGGNVAVYNKGKLYTLKSSNTKEDLLVCGGTATSGQGSNIYIGYTSATPPTASFKWGSFLGGDIYAGPNAKVTIAENPVIDYLLVSSGIKVTFATFTEGGSVKVRMTDRTGVFGTGTAASIDYLSGDYALKHEGGDLSLVAPTSLSLRYDDRKNLSDLIGTTATNVTITNQTVTSKKTGTAVADTAVLTYDAATDTLIAVGTGTATVNAAGKSYPVTVEAAPISLLMITGHSIGEGYLADGELSVVCEAGQVYGSYGRESLTGSAGGLGYGADTRVSDSLDIYAPGNGGSASGAAGLGWRYNQLTGEKVWVLNAAVSGACINEWQPGAANHSGRYSDYYYTAVTMFNNAQTVIANEVAAGHYTFSHMAMYYFNAGNFKWYEGWTQEKLQQDYATFWGGMKQALSMDMDGDGTAETVESLGLIPAWSPTWGAYNDDKAASYYMAASDEYPDIYIALDYRNWVTDLSSFPVYEYETQSGVYWQPESIQHTNKGGSSDKSIFCYNDTTHHSQIGYNAIGISIAENLFARLSGAETTAAVWQTINAKDAPETITVDVGESVSLIPLLEPVYGSDVTITVTGSLKKTYPVIITATGSEGGTVTISANGAVLDTVTIKVRPEHKHCLCGGVGKIGDHTTCTDVQWTPISAALQEAGLTTQTADFGKLPAGNYYLDTDVVVTATSSIGTANGVKPTAAKDLKICLNGHNITTRQSRVFGNVKAGSKLTIADCTGSGTVYGGTATYGQIIYTHAKSTLNIFGGNFTSQNTATAAGLFAIACDSCGDLNGDGKEDDTDKSNSAAKSVFNLYGGKIYDGKAADGGNIVLYHGADMTMYGGIITGGQATTGNGGNIMSYTTGNVNIRGGEISNGTSTKGYGGNIVNSSGTLRLYGGEVLGGTAATYAGSIHNVKTFYMYGGTVSGGRSGSNAGGNIMVGTGSNFYIYGGIVCGGTAPNNYGGNIMALGTVYLCGGTIENGTATYGGNVAVYNKGKLYTLKSSNTKEELLVSGGTATSGQGSSIYIGYTSATPPTANFKWGSFVGGDIYAGPYANVIIGENPVIDYLYVSSGIKVTFNAFTEGAAVTVTMADVNAAIGTGAAADAKYLHSADESYIVTCRDGQYYLAVPVAKAGETLYATVTEAAENGYVVLLTDVTEDVVISQQVYLDLAGHTLTGSVTGSGTLYGMDSATDTYTAGGRITGTVSCNIETQFKTNVSGKIRRYMAIADDNGYTFNRFYIGITHMHLKPGVDGVGYKATIAGNDAVLQQVKSYGYKLWITEDKVAVAAKDGAPVDNMTTVTARVQNFDVENYGETPVNGSVFIELQDGTVIESSASTFTLRDMLEAISAKTDTYTESQLSAVKAMVSRFANAMSGWDIANILSWTATETA